MSGPLERRAAGFGPHRPHAPLNTTFKKPAAPEDTSFRKPAAASSNGSGTPSGPLAERRMAPRAPRPATEDERPHPVARRPAPVVERVTTSHAPPPPTSYAPRPAARPFIGGDTCSVCGRSPATILSLRRHMGLIIVMRFAKLNAPFCREHGEAVAKEFLRRTLVEGWWGLFSFFLNWFAIYVDMQALREIRRLPRSFGPDDPSYMRQLPDEIRIAATETAEDRVERRSVAWTAVAAIAIGAVGLIVANLKHFGADTTTHRVGFEIALTTLVYGCVAFLVFARLGHFSLRPRVAEGSPGVGIITGLCVGGACALVLGAINSAISGHVTSDPRILGVLSEGTTLAVAGVLFISLVAAPLLEEFLFRGLLVESLRTKGRTSAILGGAVAFSLWHLNPAALRYYVLMGFLFGFLYWRFGLAGSISAHAAFNGVLTVFAFMAMSGSVVLSGTSGVSATLPGGWSEAHIKNAPPNFDLTAQSAGGAGLIVGHVDLPTLAVPKADRVPPGATNIHTAVVAGTNALSYDTASQGHELKVFLVGRGHRAYIVTFIPEHSEKAAQQMPEILQKLSLPPA